MHTLKEKLGARIKARRKELGLSQEALAELVNMDTPNLSNIERGKRFMTAETLERIAQALKTSERELFDFSEHEPEKYYRSDIQKYLDTQKADIDRTNSEKAIFEKVTGDAKVEIQQSMIDREADQLAEEYKQKLSMQGFSWDQAVEAQGYDNIMNSLKEDAAMRVKNSLVIDKIAKEENLVVSQAEFGAKLSEIGRMYQMDTPTMIKQLSQTPGVFNAISQQALNEKVTQFLAENNTVKFK